MDNTNPIIQRLGLYQHAFPDIFRYQIATKALIAVWVFLFKKIFQALLHSSGRVAVTSGDYKFLFLTWQGLLILFLGLVSLFLYTAFDLNSKIILSGKLLTHQRVPFMECVKEGLFTIKHFLNIRGLLTVLYIAFIAPILGVGISISLTEGLYIPTFISAFIKDSVLYSALAGFAVLVFLSVGIAHLFVLHGINIDKLSMAEACRQSTALIRANWKDYLKQNILYIISIAVALTGVAVLFLFLPLKLLEILSLPKLIGRPLTIFFVIAGVIISLLADLLATPLYIIKMTQLYFSYQKGWEFQYQELVEKRKDIDKKEVILAIAAVITIVFILDFNFDRIFPLESNVKVIAHRGGGNEGEENTLSGLTTAWKAGAYGSEIDIQRTKDGYYVLNHDSTFKRVAGVRKKPEDMTLAEIRKLSIGGEPVPTFEEMLEASKGRILLFTELKGNTADRKMADDAVRLVKQYHMEKECVLISLKYDLIDYIETSYPEIQTGFLTFASFGRTAQLNCDYLGLEEESATADTIGAIHFEGKKVLVWTPNEKESQRHFLCSQVDGLITDNVVQAMNLITELEKRSDLDRIIDTVKTIL